MIPVKRPRTAVIAEPPAPPAAERPADGQGKGPGEGMYVISQAGNTITPPAEAARTLASLEDIDPAQLQALRELVRKVVPLEKIESALGNLVDALKAQQRDSEHNQRQLVQGVGKALNYIGGQISEKLASEQRAQATKYEEQLRAAREEAKKDAAARAKRHFLGVVLAISVSSILVIGALMWFVRWNEMANLRDKNGVLAKETATLEVKKTALVADLARSEEAIVSKKNELGQLESRYSEMLQQLQGTTEAFKAVQGARTESEVQIKRLQQLAAQKLIPSGKPGDYFVEINPNDKPFVGQNGKTYIRVK